jgi:hypothetical protein
VRPLGPLSFVPAAFEDERAIGLRVADRIDHSGGLIEGEVVAERSSLLQESGGGLVVAQSLGGTVARFRVQWQPSAAMRIIQLFLKATLKRQFAQHCTNLKTELEGSSTP